MKRIHAKVTGKVQGVFYRASTRDTARALGLTGWVKNMPDGSVELEAQGPEDKLEQLVIWLNQGPPYSRVDKVLVTEIPPVEGETEFVVDF
ncbi:MAG: acylphosphatase [Thermodesulfobacteria bacterium]|nr:acylphosphatase [Thermodesulfobacteriota bacterium]